MHSFRSGAYARVDSDVELTNLPQAKGKGQPKDLPAYPFWRTMKFAELWEGWRFGASLGACLAYSVFLINTAVTIWASRRSAQSGGHIFRGNCNVAANLSTGIHLIVNLLGTLLLGASNYTMQCLCAPTRREIDTAHRQARWLDIGVQSLRNLRFIGSYKPWLWLVLGLLSVPLHLFYNSVFYPSSANHDYELYFASEAWVHGAWYDSQNLPARDALDIPVTYETDPAEMQSAVMHNASEFEPLDPEDCIDAYAHSFIPDRSNVILVSTPVYNESEILESDNDNVARNSSLHLVITANNVAGSNADPYSWICDNWGSNICDNSKAKERAAAGNWTVYGYNISSCLSQRIEEQCSVNFNLVIAIIVIIANLGKALCITAACLTLNDQPLITIGDAVASFLRIPDSTTAGYCLATMDDIRDNWADLQSKNAQPPPKKFFLQYLRRYHAVGKKSWIIFFFLFGSAILITLGLLIYAVTNLSYYDRGSFSAIWALGLGVASSLNLISGWALPSTGSRAVLSAILVANSPQVILSGLYLVLNNLVTRLQLAAEWARFSRDRKSLRVSHLRAGRQRSTYFLQVPYRVGVPLLTAAAALHWLVSQAIFLASVDAWDAQGRPDVGDSVVTCGFSPLAMIFAMIVLALVAAFVVALGARRLEAGMPLVGSCSAGIAAACHPPEGGDDEQEPLMWGAAPEGLLGEKRVDGTEGKKVGHCCFSSGRVDVPIEGRLYN